MAAQSMDMQTAMKQNLYAGTQGINPGNPVATNMQYPARNPVPMTDEMATPENTTQTMSERANLEQNAQEWTLLAANQKNPPSTFVGGLQKPDFIMANPVDVTSQVAGIKWAATTPMQNIQVSFGAQAPNTLLNTTETKFAITFEMNYAAEAPLETLAKIIADGLMLRATGTRRMCRSITMRIQQKVVYAENNLNGLLSEVAVASGRKAGEFALTPSGHQAAPRPSEMLGGSLADKMVRGGFGQFHEFGDFPFTGYLESFVHGDTSDAVTKLQIELNMDLGNCGFWHLNVANKFDETGNIGAHVMPSLPQAFNMSLQFQPNDVANFMFAANQPKEFTVFPTLIVKKFIICPVYTHVAEQIVTASITRYATPQGYQFSCRQPQVTISADILQAGSPAGMSFLFRMNLPNTLRHPRLALVNYDQITPPSENGQLNILDELNRVDRNLIRDFVLRVQGIEVLRLYNITTNHSEALRLLDYMRIVEERTFGACYGSNRRFLSTPQAGRNIPSAGALENLCVLGGWPVTFPLNVGSHEPDYLQTKALGDRLPLSVELEVTLGIATQVPIQLACLGMNDVVVAFGAMSSSTNSTAQ